MACSRAIACVRKYGPCRFRADQFLEALLAGVENVGALPRRPAGVVDERVDRAMTLAQCPRVNCVRCSRLAMSTTS
jgi:hypothetical protein